MEREKKGPRREMRGRVPEMLILGQKGVSLNLRYRVNPIRDCSGDRGSHEREREEMSLRFGNPGRGKEDLSGVGLPRRPGWIRINFEKARVASDLIDAVLLRHP